MDNILTKELKKLGANIQEKDWYSALCYERLAEILEQNCTLGDALKIVKVLAHNNLIRVKQR